MSAQLRGDTVSILDASIASDLEPTRQVRVLVVDDDELIQAGIRAVLTQQSWVGQCYGAGSLETAVVAARRWQPSIALVELSVAGRPGIEVSRALSAAHPHMRMLLMSRVGRISRTVARANGGHGFISKSIGAAAVAEAVRLLSQGRSVFPREEAAEAEQLSRRELDVLEHLVQGYSNPEVAQVLHLSRHTVKQHTCAVYRKLAVRNRAEAAAKARQLGLVG
jgi:DNA-binding NarL/FixJ family response regulator